MMATALKATEPYPYVTKYGENDLAMVVKDGRVIITVEVPPNSWFGLGLGKSVMYKATMLVWVNNGREGSTVYDTIAPGHYLNITDNDSSQLTNELIYNEENGRMTFITSRLLDPNDPNANPPPKTPEYVIKLVHITFFEFNPSNYSHLHSQ